MDEVLELPVIKFVTSDADHLLAYWWMCESDGVKSTGATRKEALERWIVASTSAQQLSRESVIALSARVIASATSAKATKVKQSMQCTDKPATQGWAERIGDHDDNN
jgi:hypothetical protein